MANYSSIQQSKKKNTKCLAWLMEKENPGVRYLAMRDLLGVPEDDSELNMARLKAHREGPIATILAAMKPEGYWVTPGAGYSCKYKSGVWSLIMLAQLGASVSMDERILTACQYLMEHAYNKNGQFSTSGPPSGTIDCLQGNLCATLLDLGYEDNRLAKAFEWMARTVTGDGLAPMEEKRAPLRYYAGKYGPGFACGANNKLSCAWGAAKVMLAFSKLPVSERTPLVDAAIKQGVEFFFSIDPVEAIYPCGWNNKPSRNWWKFGFPVFYVTDILQVAEAMVGLGLGKDPRLKNTMDYIANKQDQEGRWLMEYPYKTWVDFGEKKQPNKWVTYRALRVLKVFQSD